MASVNPQKIDEASWQWFENATSRIQVNSSLQEVPVPILDLQEIGAAVPSVAQDGNHSDTSEEEEKPRGRKRKKPRRVKIYLWKLCDSDVPKFYPSEAAGQHYTISRATPSHRTFVVVQNVLTRDDLDLIHTMPSHPASVDCNDRHKKLDFRHQVHRIERALKEDETGEGEELYYRLLRMMVWADHELWNRLEHRKKVYPEVEYISYDATGGEPKYIEPHVDNDSIVTVVVMLSQPWEYTGGVSMFKGARSGAHDRSWQLEMGDAVFFRGESLTHWITPVTDGKRAILQIELSKK